jgi:two-component system cell cycle sensor histidine kinase/response regulator CckA
MKSRLFDWFLPPIFDDPEETRLAGVAHWILTGTLIVVLVGSVLAIAHPDPLPALLSFAVTVGILLLAKWLLRSGRREFSSTLFLSIGWAVVTFNMVMAGGLRSPAIVGYPLLVLLAGVLRGARASFAVAGLGVLTAFAALLLEGRGFLPVPDSPVAAARFGTGVVIAVSLSALIVQLMQRSQQRADENRVRLEAQLQQSERMEAVGRLAGGIAHDINNYLTVILGNAQGTALKLRQNSRLLPALMDIEVAAERSAALVYQLLAFSRNQPSSPRAIDPGLFVTELDRMLRRILGEQIELRTTVGKAVGHVRIDPALFEAALINLIVNARDAMPGGGTLTVEIRRVDFDRNENQKASSLGPGPYVAIEVTDTGEGMSEATKARIFEPFFTTKSPGDGTGLGLASVYGTVKQSGGSIEVESQPSRGSTFRIYLPQVDDQKEESVVYQPPITESRSGSETVLLVEDQDPVRAFMAGVLRGHGYMTLEGTNGIEALELAERHEGAIDLLVTDVIMPQMGGIDLASRLVDSRPGTEVLFVSGYIGAVPSAGELHESGAGLLSKPFTASELLRRVHHCLHPDED